MFAAWVADQELESIKRRTRDGLERARQQGKVLGPPRKVGPRSVGGDAVDAGRRRQPPDDRQRVRVLTQHRDAGDAAGRGGAMTTDVPQPIPHCLPAGLLLAPISHRPGFEKRPCYNEEMKTMDQLTLTLHKTKDTKNKVVYGTKDGAVIQSVYIDKDALGDVPPATLQVVISPQEA